MSVDCVVEETRWGDIAELAQIASDAVLSRLGMLPDAYEISVLACNDARIAALNADFRGKPQPTNVLSWPSEERSSQIDGDMPDLPKQGPDSELGDIAIAFETCMREAEAANKTMRDHTLHLLIHGTLHLLGFDHERDRDATLMEGLETEILGKLGICDPYKDRLAQFTGLYR
ncbi:rRNA maturation RNase YbeY [Yoonia sp. BS5-3]|uniref:Endoribonuclease YbeY n=1 Tax=Yoonia phaeophyticola TaxID=3137369 RepID=A0ABZ2V7X7_9RHOB